MSKLPARPNLEHLKKQAKHLQQAFRKGNPEAAKRLRVLSRFSARTQQEIFTAKAPLQKIQHAIGIRVSKAGPI